MNWLRLYSQCQTTSIQRKDVLTFQIFHQLQFPACHKMSLGSQILATSQFSQITKWTEAWALDSDRYFILDWNVHQAVWWIIIPKHLFSHLDFLDVGSFTVKGYMVFCHKVKELSY